MEMTNRDPDKDRSTRVGKERYCQVFGTSPDGTAKSYNMIDHNNDVDKNRAEPKHVMWALMFLRGCNKESTNCAMAGGVDEKTFHK